MGPPGFKFVAKGAEFTYSVSVEAGNYTESLSTQGKLNDSIVIEVREKDSDTNTNAHTHTHTHE